MFKYTILVLTCSLTSLSAWSQGCPKSVQHPSGTVLSVVEGNKVAADNPQMGRMWTDPLQKVYDSTKNRTEPEQQRIAEWALCHLRNAAPRQGSSNEEDLDVVTPQVPGCPRYLRKSLVTWRQVGNPQLNTWEITNRSDQTLKVSYRDGGSNSSPDTLPPGQSTQVGLYGTQVPPYVVRNFSELWAFDRANVANGKSLQCELAIRPR